jgi:CHASE2 domain-containing sensor protein
MTSWQEILTAVPDRMGWLWFAGWGVLALIGAGIMFVKMIVNEPFSSLLVARALLGVGLLLIPLSALQPGWQPWINVFYAAGGFLSSVLIATNWCNRPDKSVGMLRAIGRWIIGRFDALYARTHKHEDAPL